MKVEQYSTAEIPKEELPGRINENLYLRTDDMIYHTTLLSVTDKSYIIQTCTAIPKEKLVGAFKKIPCTDGICTRCKLDQI